MSALGSIAFSGLQAAQTRLAVSAHNVANMDTPGQAAQRVREVAAGDLGGVSTQVVRASGEGVSLEREALEQITASAAYRANVFVLRAAQATAGSVLDLLA